MTTTKALAVLSREHTKTELSEELGISRPTLNNRLSGKTRWKVLEMKWINKLYNDLTNNTP